MGPGDRLLQIHRVVVAVVPVAQWLPMLHAAVGAADPVGPMHQELAPVVAAGGQWHRSVPEVVAVGLDRWHRLVEVRLGEDRPDADHSEAAVYRRESAWARSLRAGDEWSRPSRKWSRSKWWPSQRRRRSPSMRLWPSQSMQSRMESPSAWAQIRRPSAAVVAVAETFLIRPPAVAADDRRHPEEAAAGSRLPRPVDPAEESRPTVAADLEAWGRTRRE